MGVYVKRCQLPIYVAAERKTIEAIQKAAFTGEVGDGKIFSYEVRNVVKIRTGERDVDALQD